MSDSPEPSFADLLRSNLRLLLYMVLYVGVAFLVWRGLIWLFPDFGWLRIPGT